MPFYENNEPDYINVVLANSTNVSVRHVITHNNMYIFKMSLFVEPTYLDYSSRSLQKGPVSQERNMH